jgi:hypothetical protein
MSIQGKFRIVTKPILKKDTKHFLREPDPNGILLCTNLAVQILVIPNVATLKKKLTFARQFHSLLTMNAI